MPKNIVFCADGTWDGPPEQTGTSAMSGDDTRGELAQGSLTNVVKLFANLAGHVTPQTIALQNEQEKVLLDASGAGLQVAKYMHGVGDSTNLIIRLLGGAFGLGIIARIVRGYTFISRNYLSGDAIHIVGFSRGAYTARALAGMIAKVGLLDPRTYDAGNADQAYRLGIAAWCKAKRIAIAGKGTLTSLADHAMGLVESLLAHGVSDSNFITGVPIRTVAVWDTVGSMGIPFYDHDHRYDMFRFVDTALSPTVQFGFHAMAIDELRIDFPVTRWDPRANIAQTWFIGAHADVGGGYPPDESGLSDIALAWMMQRLTTPAIGVLLNAPLIYAPVTTHFDATIHTPWLNPPFNLSEQSPRAVLPGDVIHASVAQRFSKAVPAYRPQALAKVLKGGILSGVKADDGG